MNARPRRIYWIGAIVAAAVLISGGIGASRMAWKKKALLKNASAGAFGALNNLNLPCVKTSNLDIPPPGNTGECGALLTDIASQAPPNSCRDFPLCCPSTTIANCAAIGTCRHQGNACAVDGDCAVGPTRSCGITDHRGCFYNAADGLTCYDPPAPTSFDLETMEGAGGTGLPPGRETECDQGLLVALAGSLGFYDNNTQYTFSGSEGGSWDLKIVSGSPQASQLVSMPENFAANSDSDLIRQLSRPFGGTQAVGNNENAPSRCAQKACYYNTAGGYTCYAPPSPGNRFPLLAKGIGQAPLQASGAPIPLPADATGPITAVLIQAGNPDFGVCDLAPVTACSSTNPCPGGQGPCIFDIGSCSVSMTVY